MFRESGRDLEEHVAITVDGDVVATVQLPADEWTELEEAAVSKLLRELFDTEYAEESKERLELLESVDHEVQVDLLGEGSRELEYTKGTGYL